MSTDLYLESRRVCPSIHGNKFDTANRKRAVANIFENVNQDKLMRLFQKTGDMKAEERVRSIFSFAHDPEETAKALMALKQRKKDKFLRIAGMTAGYIYNLAMTDTSRLVEKEPHEMKESLVNDTSPFMKDGMHEIWSRGGARSEGIPRREHAEPLVHHNVK